MELWQQKEEGGSEQVRTPVRVRVQRLEADKASTGKKKYKRKREEPVLETGQKRIVDLF